MKAVQKNPTCTQYKVLLYTTERGSGTKVCMYARLDFALADVEYNAFESAAFYTMYQRLFPLQVDRKLPTD